MDLLSGLSSLMGGGSNQSSGQQGGGLESMLAGLMGGGGAGSQGPQGGNLGALGGLLSSSGLGGLASALMGGDPAGANPSAPGKASRAPAANAGGLGGLLGSLMGGSSSPVLDKHQDTIQQADPRYGKPVASSPADRVMRMLRAMIYAAKADGHIDQAEQNAITGFLQKNNIGPEGMKIIQSMINEPLDPRVIAQGLQDSREAMQVYGLSCAVCGNDHPAERRYLDDLAQVMGIPAKVKADIEKQVGC